MMDRILILSPHTDDAELGCGGTISKYISQGKKLLWVVLSTAEESLPQDVSNDTLRNEFLEVAEKLKLNANQLIIRNFKVRYLHEKRQEILELLVNIRKNFNPELVIGPSLHDLHQDHSIVANEMLRAFKSYSSIISYELPWNHLSFNTQLFVKLSKAEIDFKIELLSSYKSQLLKQREYFSESFIIGLAKIRGVQVKADFAEAFEVVRWIS
jgi:LmbE family N-acetylglucosaminyl deacetylase